MSSPKKELNARTRRLPTKLPLKRHVFNIDWCIPIWLTIPADTLLHFVRLHLYLPQHTPTPKNPNREITDTLMSWSKMYTYIPHKKLTAFAPSFLLCANTFSLNITQTNYSTKNYKSLNITKNDIYSLQKIGNPSQFSSLYELPLHEQNTFDTALRRRLKHQHKTLRLQHADA